MQKDNEKFCRPMISCKTMTKILYRNSEKSFLECEKNGFKKHLLAFFSREFFFMFVLLISNHTVFLALVSFSKSWNCTRRSGLYNFSFLKNSLVQLELIPKWTRKTVWLPRQIVRHEVQLLINRIYSKFRGKNVFWELFLSDNVCSAFPKFWKL